MARTVQLLMSLMSDDMKISFKNYPVSVILVKLFINCKQCSCLLCWFEKSWTTNLFNWQNIYKMRTIIITVKLKYWINARKKGNVIHSILLGLQMWSHKIQQKFNTCTQQAKPIQFNLDILFTLSDVSQFTKCFLVLKCWSVRWCVCASIHHLFQVFFFFFFLLLFYCAWFVGAKRCFSFKIQYTVWLDDKIRIKTKWSKSRFLTFRFWQNSVSLYNILCVWHKGWSSKQTITIHFLRKNRSNRDLELNRLTPMSRDSQRRFKPIVNMLCVRKWSAYKEFEW